MSLCVDIVSRKECKIQLKNTSRNIFQIKCVTCIQYVKQQKNILKQNL